MTPHNLRRPALLGRTRAAMILAFEQFEKYVATDAKIADTYAGIVERLARADDLLDKGATEGRPSAPKGATEGRNDVNEVLDSKNVSSASSTKRASSKKIPSGSSGERRGRKPLEYHLDNRFNLMLKAFPMERTGSPARAFALWKTLDTDRKAQLEVAIYDYLQKTKPEFYTQFVTLVESWVAQHPPQEENTHV